MSKERMGMLVNKEAASEVSVHKEIPGYLWRRCLYPVAG